MRKRISAVGVSMIAVSMIPLAFCLASLPSRAEEAEPSTKMEAGQAAARSPDTSAAEAARTLMELEAQIGAADPAPLREEPAEVPANDEAAASKPAMDEAVDPTATGSLLRPSPSADETPSKETSAAVKPTDMPVAILPAVADPAELPSPAAPQNATNPSSAPAVSAPAAAVDHVPTRAERLQSAVEAAAQSEAKISAEARKERDAIGAFYAARAYAPLWSAEGGPTAAAEAAIARLDHADEDGLSVTGLGLPPLHGDDAALAAADLALSQAVVAYARQATGSRIDPHQISALIGAKPELADPAEVLAKISAAGSDAGAQLEAYNPPQKAYQALRSKLIELRRARRPATATIIPAGPPLKVGMHDPRVPLIRARFNLDGQLASAPADLLYDTRIAAAVADFQKTKGLPASGVLTARTVAALSGGQPSRLENEILANMERWRWMPRDLGDSRIEVNIPDFMVSVIDDGRVVSRNKVVVGKQQTPTPVFSNRMQFLIVNPYWNVPESIIRKEMLPKMGGDTNYLRQLGYEVLTRHGHMIVRQPPGERNALGRVKFMFPNDYAVYLHDTPSRGLFSAQRRAFSHGCVRVDDPFRFAEAVLGRDNGWSEQRVMHLIGGSERYVYLPKPLPIHIEYFTAYVDETGRLQLRDDIYGYSHRVKEMLGLEG